MNKRVKTTIITIVIVMTILFTALLTGCSIKFPKDEETLLTRASQEWKDGKKRTITDTITLKQMQISIPVTIYGANKTFNATFTSGEITINRTINQDNIDISLGVKNLKVEVDKTLAEYIPSNITLARLDKITLDVSMDLTPNKMTVTTTIRNVHLVVDGEQAETINTIELNGTNYKQQYLSFRTLAAMSLFGNIQPDGNLSKESKGYNYTLPSAKVNEEIFRIPKILVDASSPIILDGDSLNLSELLLKYFLTSDLTVALNSFLLPNDMRVTTTLEVGANAYYFSSFNGNYIASGTMSTSTSRKIFDDVINEMKKTNGSDILNAVSLSGGIKVELKMTISSSLRILDVGK